jgi:hypothetical protein
MRRATIASLAILLGTAAVLSATGKGPMRVKKPISSLPAVTATAPASHARTPALRRAGAQIEGRWTLDARENGEMQINLSYERNSNWGHSIDRADLEGLTDAQINSATSTPVAFRVQREAGLFEMEGSFRAGEGAGHFRFHPDRQFAATLRSLGVVGAERATDKELLTLAMADASSATLRELMGMGIGQLDMEAVIELSIFEITPEYVRELREVGVTGTNSAENVVELRIHQITADYVRELASLGFRDLDREDLLEMGIHGVSARQVAELREMGYSGLSAEQLVEMAIFDVTPEFIREVREAGFRDLSADALVQMKIHGIGSEYVRKREN